MGAPDFIIFAAFAAILAALLIGCTLAAAPLRRKLVGVANELYDAPVATDRLRNRIDFMLDTSASPIIAVLLIVSSIVTVIDAIFFSDDEPRFGFEDDARYIRLVGLYLGSVLLANPLASIFLLPISIVCALLHSGAKGIRAVRMAEAQIERVAHSRLART
jgi:hypothetical protein